jgi:hypothetical protein
LTTDGVLSYPYSTRELVSIVRHLERYPDDGIVNVLKNVFDFDALDTDRRGQIETVFWSHGIPMVHDDFEFRMGVARPLDVFQAVERWSIGEPSPLKSEVRTIPLRMSWKLSADRKRLDTGLKQLHRHVLSEATLEFHLGRRMLFFAG